MRTNVLMLNRFGLSPSGGEATTTGHRRIARAGPTALSGQEATAGELHPNVGQRGRSVRVGSQPRRTVPGVFKGDQYVREGGFRHVASGCEEGEGCVVAHERLLLADAVRKPVHEAGSGCRL